jgi:hypothetical protein
MDITRISRRIREYFERNEISLYAESGMNAIIMNSHFVENSIRQY